MTFKTSIKNATVQHEIANSLIGVQLYCHGLAVEGGWWTDLDTGEHIDRNSGECYALMHSELSEGFEGHRKNLMDEHLPEFKNEEVELADAIIRILDYAGGKNLRVAQALAAKLVYNTERVDHTIEHRKSEHGKKV